MNSCNMSAVPLGAQLVLVVWEKNQTNPQTDMATVLQYQVYPEITSVAGEFMSALYSQHSKVSTIVCNSCRVKHTGVISQWQQ